MHVSIGDLVLQQLGVLPAAVAALLARHPLAYLFGNIAADVVFAKRLSKTKQFCHHWTTAFRLLHIAPTDADRSFAFGYLSHLAADTVAHGKYVPHQILISGSRINVGHLYWELRADQTRPESVWQRLASLELENHDRHHSALAGQMSGAFLIYPLNRMLFSRINSVAARAGFRRTVQFCTHHSRWYLSKQLLGGFESQCVDRVISVLSAEERSAVTREDPNGTSALMQLRAHRRYLRRKRLTGGPVAARRLEAARGFRPSSDTPA